MSALNNQVGGTHYKDFAIQPVEFIHRNEIDFISGNVIKYICRWKSKGGINDLEKAKHYIELLIELSKYEPKCECNNLSEHSLVNCACECHAERRKNFSEALREVSVAHNEGIMSILKKTSGGNNVGITPPSEKVYCCKCPYTVGSFLGCECHCHKETKVAVPDKEITDTERLDFIENEMLTIEFSRFMGKNVFEVVSTEEKPSGSTIRKAIDAAMRGKDEK